MCLIYLSELDEILIMYSLQATLTIANKLVLKILESLKIP